MTGQVKEEVLRLLKAVRLGAAYYDRLPRQLSGGEKQRILIAMAFKKMAVFQKNKSEGPALYIFDEPTGNLDPEVSHGIFKLFLEINKSGTAIIMATHNYNLIKRFPSRTLKCEDGRLSGANLSEAELDRLIQNE